MPSTLLRRLFWLALAALVALVAGRDLLRLRTAPEVSFLWPGQGAEWILAEAPSRLRPLDNGLITGELRRRFTLAAPTPGGRLEITAMRAAAVYLDGALLSPPATQTSRWKEPREVALPPLAPGEHVLELRIANRNGPVAALIREGTLGLSSGAGWEGRQPDGTWAPAALATARWETAMGRNFPRPAEALPAVLPWLLPIFLVAAGLTLGAHSRQKAAGPASPFAATMERWLAPDRLRWILLLAWAALATRSLPAFASFGRGFDFSAHVDYIVYIADSGRLPLPSDGWQMFQTPLFYLLAAPLWKLCSSQWNEQVATLAVRTIPLACGAAQIELCWRTARLALPGRADLQRAALLVGALLPMAMYSFQFLGNEPLAAVTTAGAMLYAMRWLGSEPTSGIARHAVVLGALVGAAILTKATALLLLPLAAGVAVLVELKRGGGWRTMLRAPLVVGVSTAVVAGWYFVRNWMLLGKPLISGWDPLRQFFWWQEPGYRSFEHVTRFGLSLQRPVYAGTAGLWDSLYSSFWADGWLGGVIAFGARPPWRYDWMVIGAWLALPLTLAIAVGLVINLRPRQLWERPLLFLVAASVALYLAAIVRLYLFLPIYTTGKASYLLGLTPCFGVLAATAIRLLDGRPLARAAAWGLLACWAVAAYTTYFPASP